VHSARFDADGPYGHAAGRTLVIDDLAELDATQQVRLAACLEASRAAEGPRVVAVTALDPAASGAAEGRTYRHFSVAAQNRLRYYHWPGNVAELFSLVRQVWRQGRVSTSRSTRSIGRCPISVPRSSRA